MTPQMVALFIWLCGSESQVARYSVEPGKTVTVECKGSVPTISYGTVFTTPCASHSCLNGSGITTIGGNSNVLDNMSTNGKTSH